jgi:hypothetical protein
MLGKLTTEKDRHTGIASYKQVLAIKLLFNNRKKTGTNWYANISSVQCSLATLIEEVIYGKMKTFYLDTTLRSA